MTDTFSRPVLDLMAQRISCRTYQPVPLAAEKLSQLEACLKQPVVYPFPGTVRFALLDNGQAAVQAQKIGTYGTIRGARYYIAGAVRRGPGALENFGYGMERIILHATDWGLGTCWLGGSLHRSEIGPRLGAGSDEYVPAMTPVGLPAERPGLQDQMLRWSAGSSQRKSWSELFFWEESRQPLTPETTGSFAPVLEAVRRAPSASNRQPWRVLVNSALTRFRLYLKRNVWYSQAAHAFMQAEDIQRLDLGIAQCHFELAAQALKLAGAWSRSGTKNEAPAGWEFIAAWEAQTA